MLIFPFNKNYKILKIIFIIKITKAIQTIINLVNKNLEIILKD